MKKILFIITIIIIIISACTTKKNTFVTRFYHNLTSHYNAYFNGNEAYKQGIKKINSNPQDNFSLILNVFPIINEDANKQASSDMERAKEKAAIVIKKHSITVKPERKKGNLTQKQKDFYNRTEFCNWVPDSWLMHGKANFVNHDWYAAEENFEYIVKEYSWDPIKYEAAIWLALTYVQLTKFDDSKAILDRADGDKDFPSKLKKFLYQSYVQLHIKQQNYSEAITKLITAIKLTKKRQEKARLYYILAQLYQLNNNFSQATKAYTYAIKYSNRYEMVFNAQINRATCFEGTNAEYLRKELFKMLKDDKNIDYYDQIYYAIANLYSKENQQSEAIKYYRLSIQNNKSNSNQKALTYIALGDMYFNLKNYVNAQAYYDSSITLLSHEHPQYKRVEKLATSLETLAQNLKIIHEEDSLQYLAKLPEKERNKIIDEIIQKILDEERRKQEEQQQEAQNILFMNQQNLNPLSNQNQGGKWYFYNPSALALGAAEFKRKWGTRKLEDDWRRKNKSVVLASLSEETTENITSQNQQAANLNPKQREYYLKNLPLTDSLMNISNKRIEEALFKSGEAAMNQIEDFHLAIKQFITLIDRFPDTKYKLIAYYDLYRLNIKIGKEDVANLYKNKIIQEFPVSKYAQLLTNPNYLKELEAKNNRIKSLYEEAYYSFKDDDFSSVFRNFRIADSLYNDSPIYVKFRLLRALTIGKTGNFNEYKTELTNIIEKYPGTQEKQHAEFLLATINNYDPTYLASLKQQSSSNKLQANNTSMANNNEKTNQKLNNEPVKEEADDPMFTFNENDNCQLLILLDKNADINRLKYNLFGYNIDYFSMFDFQILTGIWNDKYYYLKVFPFTNYTEAVKYYKHVNKHTDIVFRNINDKHYQFFVISDANYVKLQSTGEIERYQKFFRKKYLKKKQQ